ncbi:hypothetical protein OSB04_021625 [Centaurea solstitialis]|uniref:Dynamin stalk domain-containing protein n=1 Tax=Centaurea solstitialis TaxID=347529 RepID=A0AA38W538_9ASTR|nr:hypothetical protein OSB04_021625 [Centaurea solstitialis]
MSRRADPTKQRTLAVVTQCDLLPDSLPEKVAGLGLGYVCVANPINNQTYDEAREASLFRTGLSLSKMDKSAVGVPVLAKRLVEIQSMILSKHFPGNIKKIDEELDSSVTELKKLSPTMADAATALVGQVFSLKESLHKILIRGELDELYEDDNQMHCKARLLEMLNKFSEDLYSSSESPGGSFMAEEIEVLKTANGVLLPHSRPHSAFLFLVGKRVKSVSNLPIDFVNEVSAYLETVVNRVVDDCCRNSPQLHPSMMKAARTALAKLKKKLLERAAEMLEMEKDTCYTCDPDFDGRGLWFENEDDGLIVSKRMADWMALQLRSSIKKMVEEVANGVMSAEDGVRMMLEEPPTVAGAREEIRETIELLQKSKEDLVQV